MSHETRNAPSRGKQRARDAKSNDMVSQPFSNFTWKHGAVFMAAWVFMLAFITFSEIGVIS